jgi:flavin reductase (DIM6/NTAB) family NADH-FMN oxidoreductase RutF
MKHFTKTELQALTRFYRANIVNCITGPKPAMLCGTKSKEGTGNLALFSNVFHMGADPAIIGYVQRPVGESGHTYQNIIDTKAYTLNLANPAILVNSHYTSARFAEGISEFTECHLQEKYVNGFEAPFVEQAAVQIGLHFLEAIPVQHNNTTIVLGTIEHIFIADNLLQEDGNIKLTTDTALAAVGLEQYYAIDFLQHMAYAKVNELPKF